jgi:phospholipase/carboxylesterase
VVSLSSLIPDVVEVTADANRLPGLPVFITHGQKDEIIPPERGRASRDRYAELGARVTYHEYSTGHKVHTDGLKALKTWLRPIICDDKGGNNDRECEPDPS